MNDNPNESVTYLAIVDEKGNIVRRIKVTVTATIAEDESNGAEDEAFPWDRVVADLGGATNLKEKQ